MMKTSLSKRALSGGMALALAAAMVPVMPLSQAHADAVAGPQFQITSPLYVTFASDSYYDVANPQHSLEESCRFENMGTEEVFIAQFECTESSAGSIAAVFEKLESDGEVALADQKLFSFWNNAKKDDSIISFNHRYNDNGDTGDNSSLGSMGYSDLAEDYVIGARSGSTPGVLNCTYRLNLTNVYEVPGANATIRSDLGLTADTTTYKPIARAKYTFRPYNFILSYVDADGVSQYKSAADIKNDAITLSETAVETDSSLITELVSSDTGNANDPSALYELYEGFAQDPSSYVCKMKSQTGVWRNLNIIGVNHDNAVDASGNLTGKKAGLTLQFADAVEQRAMNTYTAVQATGQPGWGNTAYYLNYLKQGAANQASYWNSLVSSSIQEWLVPVQKHSYTALYNVANNAPERTSVTTDYLFILSLREASAPYSVEGSPVEASFTHENDGFEYALYLSDPSARIKRNSAGTAVEYWSRTTGTATAASTYHCGFRHISATGVDTGGSTAPSTQYWVSPAFCL